MSIHEDQTKVIHLFMVLDDLGHSVYARDFGDGFHDGIAT
jgi:hypothetical protein